MLSFVLNDLKNKKPYYPKGVELDYLNSERADFNAASQEYFREHKQLQNKNINDYISACESTGLGLPRMTKKDPWRNNMVTPVVQEKLDAVVAAVADLNLQPELRSFSIHGDEMNEMADGMEGLLEIAHVLNNTEDKDRFHNRQFLQDGAICKDVQFKQQIKKASRIIKESFKDGSIDYKDIPDEVEGRIDVSTIPLNRIILGDVTQHQMSNQPFIFKDYTLKYLEAWALFHEWENWSFVRPVSSVSRMWGETPIQQEFSDDIANGLVRMIIKENVWLNQFSISLNGVLMTKPGRPMPGRFTAKEYSVTWTPLIPLGKLAFGESMVYRMRNDAILRDFFVNALVDRKRQDLEPPVVTSFRTVLNRQMYRPGTATPVGSDFKVTPLIQAQTGADSAFAMIDFIDKSLSNASISPLAQGQNQGGGITALQIREQMKNQLKVMWNIFSAVAESKRQETNLMLRLIMEHYPEMGVGKVDSAISDFVGGIRKSFSTRGQVKGGEGERKVAFANLDDAPTLKISQMLEREQRAKTDLGSPQKWYLIDPTIMRKSKHVVYVIVNPTQRKSKQADKLQVREDYAVFAQNPLIDQEWNTRQLLKSSGYNPDDALKQEQPNMPQAEAQIAQAGSRSTSPGALQANPLAGSERTMSNVEQALV